MGDSVPLEVSPSLYPSVLLRTSKDETYHHLGEGVGETERQSKNGEIEGASRSLNSSPFLLQSIHMYGHILSRYNLLR